MLDEKLLLIYELLVVGAIFEKLRKKREEFLTIHEKDLLHGYGLVGVGHKDLENVEALVLDHFPIVSEKIHANLEVLAAINVRRHNVIVGAVKKQLS